MPRRILAAVAVCALLVAGCSSQTSGSGEAATPATESATPTAPASASARPGARLKSQLLTVEDLPTGWSVDSSGSANGAGTPACLRHLKDTMETHEHADVDFVKGSQFPALNQGLGRFAGSSAAVSTFTQGAGQLDKCTDISFTSDGVKVAGTIGAMSLPSFGERSRAWQANLSAQGITFVFYILMVQKGAEVQVLVYGDVGTPDVEEFSTLAKTAVDKMQG